MTYPYGLVKTRQHLNIWRCDSDITSVGVEVEAISSGDGHNTLRGYIQIIVASSYSVGYERRGVELRETAGRWNGRRYAADQLCYAKSVYAADTVEGEDVGGYTADIDCLD